MENIKTLQRQGKQDSDYGLIDDLAYTYTGNQLIKVTDAVSGPLYNGAFHFMDGADVATEYVYDKNGNLTKDYNKKIVDIQYNALNLPDALKFTNGNTTNYVYDAAGAKLSVTYQTAVAGITIPMTSVMTPLAKGNVFATTTTDYCGNVVYENGKVSRILTEEGYITLSGANPTTPTYHYYLKDHQGNNRVVLSQSGAVEQVNHYYPFGGLFGESANTLISNTISNNQVASIVNSRQATILEANHSHTLMAQPYAMMHIYSPSRNSIHLLAGIPFLEC